jgi:hypothetical protein
VPREGRYRRSENAGIDFPPDSVGPHPGNRPVVLPGTPYQKILPRGEENLRENPLEGFPGRIRKTPSFQGNALISGIVQLNPVGKIPLLIGQGGGIRRHHFIDPHFLPTAFHEREQ